MLLGGILTEYLGWQWIFFVNVPVGIAIILLATRLVSEGKAEGVDPHTDPLAAILVTAGLVSFVYAMSKAPEAGWISLQTIGLTILAAVLIAAFFVKETRTDAPLVPLGSSAAARSPSRTSSASLGGAIFGGFFLLTLYMQQVLGYSPIKTGLAFLATAGTTIPAAGIAQALVTRVGVKPVMAIGLALNTFAYVWYTQLPVDGRYWANLFIPFFASGFGLAFTFIPVSLAALSNMEDRIAGVASGLLNTSQQIGGALGVAIASTIATTHTKTLLEEGESKAAALTGGFNWAFWVASIFVAIGLVVTVAVLKRSDVPAEPSVPRGRCRRRPRATPSAADHSNEGSSLPGVHRLREQIRCSPPPQSPPSSPPPPSWSRSRSPDRPAPR